MWGYLSFPCRLQNDKRLAKIGPVFILLMAAKKQSVSTHKAGKKSGPSDTDKRTTGNKAREPWNKGLVKMHFELPVDLYERINTLAKKAGMSFERFSGIMITKHVMEEERKEIDEEAAAAVLRVIAKAYETDYKRIEEELSTLPSSAEKLQRLLLELSPVFESRYRKNKLN
jgi:hypothetical protein